MSETPPSNVPDELSKQNRYRSIIDKIFFDRYTPGLTTINFKRTDLKDAVTFLEIDLPDNLGDIIYHFRFRGSFSVRMLKTQPDGLAWRIELAGRSLYKFVLGKESRIIPSATLVKIDILDATPEIMANYALDDEQALLAVVRYNRLIDIFRNCPASAARIIPPAVGRSSWMGWRRASARYSSPAFSLSREPSG